MRVSLCLLNDVLTLNAGRRGQSEVSSNPPPRLSVPCSLNRSGFVRVKSVRVVLFDEGEESLPTYQRDRDLVVFPSQSSVTWSDLSAEELAAARRIILIDSR